MLSVLHCDQLLVFLVLYCCLLYSSLCLLMFYQCLLYSIFRLLLIYYNLIYMYYNLLHSTPKLMLLYICIGIGNALFYACWSPLVISLYRLQCPTVLITGYPLRLTYKSELLISTVLSPLITGNVNSFALKVKQFVCSTFAGSTDLQFCTGIN
jgi:hypothetical protein